MGWIVHGSDPCDAHQLFFLNIWSWKSFDTGIELKIKFYPIAMVSTAQQRLINFARHISQFHPQAPPRINPADIYLAYQPGYWTTTLLRGVPGLCGHPSWRYFLLERLGFKESFWLYEETVRTGFWKFDSGWESVDGAGQVNAWEGLCTYTYSFPDALFLRLSTFVHP